MNEEEWLLYNELLPMDLVARTWRLFALIVVVLVCGIVALVLQMFWLHFVLGYAGIMSFMLLVRTLRRDVLKRQLVEKYNRLHPNANEQRQK